MVKKILHQKLVAVLKPCVVFELFWSENPHRFTTVAFRARLALHE